MEFIASKNKIKNKGNVMLIKLVETGKIIYVDNCLEFAIITFNKDFEYINLGEI